MQHFNLTQLKIRQKYMAQLNLFHIAPSTRYCHFRLIWNYQFSRQKGLNWCAGSPKLWWLSVMLVQVALYITLSSIYVASPLSASPWGSTLETVKTYCLQCMNEANNRGGRTLSRPIFHSKRRKLIVKTIDYKYFLNMNYAWLQTWKIVQYHKYKCTWFPLSYVCS